MYTQCPRCRTVFGVTDEQLRARGGMVRCGRCRNVFQADATLFDAPPGGGPPAPNTPVRHEPVLIEEDDVAEEITVSEALAIETESNAADERHWPWWLGNLLLLLVLAGQLLWMERTRLLLYPGVRPDVSAVCRALGCHLWWREDITRIELRRVSVTAHPRYRAALEVGFTLVNRAPVGQPYPRVELSLLDPQGSVLARRSFGPAAYGRDPQARLAPNVGDRVHFGVTRPGTTRAGLSYELRTFPRRSQLP